jgi:hypothetical protein
LLLITESHFWLVPFFSSPFDFAGGMAGNLPWIPGKLPWIPSSTIAG